MIDDILIDTNVVVYVYDRSEPQKQQRAVQVLDSLQAADTGVLAPQTLAEFFVTVTRKLAAPLAVADAVVRLDHLSRSWRIAEYGVPVVLEAARGVRDYQFNFWDAQIWAVARLNQIGVVFSEDFNTGAVIEGVRFVNPFAADFMLAEWL
jgi:predicted nucleic acid-binding protein